MADSSISVRATVRVPLGRLKLYPANPRRGDVAAIVQSLRRHGQFRALVVNRPTMEVLAGNHTLLALREIGATQALVHYVEVDADQAARIVLVDNRTNDLASYEEGVLADLLSSLPDLEGTGYDERALEELVGAALSPGRDTAPSEPPADPVTRPGDAYTLGRHRLLCGDCTRAHDVDRLLAGERPALIYTDPPYGMSYRSSRHRPIAGDELRGADLTNLVRDALALAAARKAPGAGAYVWCTWRTYPEFVTALAAAGLRPSACIVWHKGRIGPGSAHYRPEHEFCLYCAAQTPGEHELCLYCAGQEWNGGRGESDVWEISRDHAYLHPTQKPIDLAERALSNSTVEGGASLTVSAARARPSSRLRTSAGEHS